MSEKRIGFIPYALDVTQKECGIFVTDQRTILVVSEPEVKGFKAGLRASFGAEADKVPGPRPAIDFATVDIESLAKMPGNLSYPHLNIDKFAVGKGIGGYGIWAVYLREDRKKDYLVVDLVPPKKLKQKRKAEGIRGKEIRRQYAMRCQEVFRRALPPIISEKVDWKI
jgi:hypothetical protein